MQVHAPASKSSTHQFLTLPRTLLGWVVAALLGLHAALLLVFSALAALSRSGSEISFTDLWLSSTMVLAGMSAVVGGLLALIAVWRCERSVLVLAVLLLGFLVIVFGFGDMLAAR